MSANPERHLCLGEGDCLAAYCFHSKLKLDFLTSSTIFLEFEEYIIKLRPYMNYSSS